MSAVNEREISHIRDEDLLKKMWQETEDFGKKKEIRAHMYKLREARLKDLYCNTDVKDVQISTNKKSSFNQSTHADSLADHSFASLKSKEIRDSESPTRDVSYRITGSTINQGWNVSKLDERSQDGKTHRIVQNAQTSGTEVIPKGKIDFEAKSKQEVTSFQDGDDRNFTRSKGVSSNSHIRQEAVGGDDHSNFRTSSTKSSSSSRTVTEQKASYGDTVDQNVSRKQLPPSQENVINTSTKIYTTDAPRELKTHPGYVEGQTKVTRETRTLADGTVVTTTKYETTGANEIKSSSSNQYSSSNSTRQENKSKTTSTSTSHDDKYSSQQTFEDRRNTTDQSAPKSRYYVEKTHTIPDNSKNIYQNVQSSHISNIQEHKHENRHQNRDAKISSDQNVNERYEIRITGDVTNDRRDRRNEENIESKTTTRQTKYQDEIRRENVDNTQRKHDVTDKVINTERVKQITSTTQDINSVPLGAPVEIEIDVTRINNINNEKINRKITSTNETSRPQDTKSPKSQDDVVYDVPQRREPIKPAESEWKTKTKATDHQYDTTYKTDYTNKRISVDVSPTHEAFARSLRAVSPDRLSSRTSSRNLKNSNTSLRSSTSPEKSFTDRRYPSKISPERQPNGRCYSPTKKTPERFSSTETVTYKSSSRPGSERNSPDKSYISKHTDNTRVTKNYSTSTTVEGKKTIDDSSNVTISTKSTRKSPTKGPSKPVDTGYYKNIQEPTTDLDDDVSIVSHTTITKTEQVRPSNLDYSTRKPKKVTDRSPTSPLNDTVNRRSPTKETPKKERPADRPLKRTDTYEERCRQILGITTETIERRRSSLEKLKRRGSSTISQSDIVTKTQQPKSGPKDRSSPPKKSPEYEKYPRPRSPSKQDSPIQEFPSQIRKSPDNYPSDRREHQEPNRSLDRKSSTDSKVIQEFPAQIRRTPEKPHYASRSSPSKEYPKEPKDKSPLKHSPNSLDGHTSISRTKTTDTTYITEKNNLVKEHSSDTLGRPKGQKVPKPKSEDHPTGDRHFPIRDHPEKSHPVNPKAREHIYEEISETRINIHGNQSTQEPFGHTPEDNRPKSTTPKEIETSPLREYPSQIRKTPVKHESDKTEISEKRVTQEVTYDVPRSHVPKTVIFPEDENPNIPGTEISRKTGEVITSELSITEVSDEYHTDTTKRTIPNKKGPKDDLPEKKSPKGTQNNVYPDQRYPKKSPEDTISICETTTTTSTTYNKNPNIGKPETARPSAPREDVDFSKPNLGSTLPAYTKPLPKGVNVPKQISEVTNYSSPKKIPSEETTMEQVEKTESTENISNETWTINTQVVKQSPQHKEPNFKKPSQPENTRIDQKPKPNSSYPSDRTNTSQNIKITETDITYVNGDTSEQEIEIDKKTPTQLTATDQQENDDSDDSLNEHRVFVTEITTQKTDSKISQKRKQKDEDYPVKEMPKGKIPERSPASVKKTPSERDIVKPQNKPLQRIPDNSSPVHEKSVKQVPKTIKKFDNKRKPRKEVPKSFVDSEDSENDEEIEETHKKTYVMETYEGRTPVEEPLVIKKNACLLYSDDEDDKKTTQLLIESEITDRQTIVDKKKPKTGRTPQTTTSKFITNEKQGLNIKTTNVSTKSFPQFGPKPTTKPLIEKNYTKPKFTGETEYIDKYNRKVFPVKDETKKQNTLSDIENFHNVKEDNTTHIRTHRIDDTVNKRKTTTLKTDINERSTKVLPKKPSASKLSPNESSKTRPNSRTHVNQVEKIIPKRNNEPIKSTPKNAKPAVPQKHTVSTTILLKPRTETKITKTSTSKTKNEITRTSLRKPTPKKIVEPEESDDESIPDSLNEDINNSVEDITIDERENEATTTRTTLNRISGSPERKTPSRSHSKPELIEDKPKTPKPKLDKKCISTKSIIINNTEKGITVDLQRSISSREPTPDRVCPLPVTSDDDGLAPRYPDKVVEPDDGSVKRKNKKLFDSAILENEEGKEVHKIMEVTEAITQRVTEVDKVDRDDDSLLTVDKKINKFLTTAEKLTEKPIVDISQPAPKVQRPKFEVDENLKEDDCLLSVSDKVNKFITEAEHLTSQNNTQHRKSVNIDIKSDITKTSHTIPQEPKSELALPRKPSTDTNIAIDVSSLSVSDKASKFVSVADRLKHPEQKRPISLSKLDRTRVDQDVFITTECSEIEKEEDLFRTSKRPSNPTLHPRREPESSSERPRHPEQNFKPYSSQPKSPERDSPKRSSPVRKISNDTILSGRKDSRSRETNEETLIETPHSKAPSRNDSLKEFTPKNRRPSQEEKVILSTVGRLRSSESIKKAKALFEKSETTKREERRQENILNRPSIFEGKNKSMKETHVKKAIDRKNVTPRKLDFTSDDKLVTAETRRTIKTYETSSREQSPEKYTPDIRSGRKPSKDKTSPDRDIPGYMKPLDRSLKPHSPQRELTPEPDEDEDHKVSLSEEDLPGYMKPLDRSTRPHSPKRDVPSNTKSSEPVGTPTKFGVTLKRTDSGKGIINTNITTVTTKRHHILSKKNITEEDVEQVYELDVLEELLLKITGYELRRKIRTQIRIVKKLIAENKLEITIQNIRNKIDTANQFTETTTKTTKTTEYQDKHTRKPSPQRKTVDRNLYSHTDRSDRNYSEKTEYTSSYSRKESTPLITRSGSPDCRGSKSPERKLPERKSPERKSPERKSPERKSAARKSPSRIITDTNVVTQNVTNYSTYKKSDRERPQEPTTKTTTVLKSSLRRTEPKTRPPIPNGQPEWVSQRNLKKVGTNEGVRKTTVSSTSTSNVKKQTIRASSPTKEVKSTDIITSSYGVGPTDENGAPLFGLRALRAQNKSGTTKVQGTVISSEYYSETGKEPVGQISVTKYSSDPRDLTPNEHLTQDEDILSITTTQKFGFEDSPSLKQLTNTQQEICDVQTDKRTTSSKSSTMTRKNSVKALTQKFVENAAEVSRNERQSTYPKAGLILRSSSFKNDSAVDQSDDYDEISAEERIQESVTLTSSNTRMISGGTFLRNKSKVTGVEDVITRMKAEDIEDGDTAEDVEAKGLLNKYLGSQVIISGIEGHVSKTATATARATSSTTSEKSTTKITTVIMENGKEVTKTRIFEHPISDEVLETVWDEQSLRYLLDQSTDYEERKRIRARLRLVMAEQEACTELVKQASQDQSGQSIDESVETSKTIVTEGPVTTTKVTSRVTTQQQVSKKPISPFAKFRQLDKQNSLNTPPSTPRTPSGSPLFKFTDAALSQSASTIKDRLLYWCRMKTKEYENIQLDNFSSSWADGLAFCALIHHFQPEAFDYHALTPKERRHNFTLAFKVADEKADIAPLLDVDDMVATRRPDWKCVFTYVQSIYRRFKDED